MNDDDKKQTLRESDFLGYLFMLVVGSMIASTGTFSKPGMGRWGSDFVSFGGWLLIALCLCGIFYHLQKLQSYTQGQYVLVFVFIIFVITGALLPFLSLPGFLGVLPFCWIVLLLVYGHFLHKFLLKKISGKAETGSVIHSEQNKEFPTNQ